MIIKCTMEKYRINKPIIGMKNIDLYFDSLQSRFPIRICGVCGQPVAGSSNRITLTEFKIDRRRARYNRQTKSKTLLYFHIECKNKLLKIIYGS